MRPKTYEILESMLHFEGSFTYQQVADELNLTERTIRNYVPEIRQFILPYNLELIAVRGTGCEIAGDAVNRANLAGDLGRTRSQKRYYKAQERVSIIIYYLLLNKNPISISFLTDKLFIARSSIYKDIQSARLWLQKFQIDLQISHRGLSLITGEKRSRLALVNLLLETDDYAGATFPDRIKLYVEQMKRPDSNDRAALNSLFSEIMVKSKLALAPSEVERLLLHFLVSFHRIKQDLWVTLQPETRRKLKDSVWSTQLHELLSQIEWHFGIRLNETELYYLSGMLLSSKFSTIEESELTIKAMAEETAWNFYNLVADYYLIKEPGLFIRGLSHHFQALFRRAQYIWDCHNPMKHEVMEYFPQAYHLASRILPDLQRYVPVEIPDDEIAFIAMHLMAALERSRDPLQALFIYDQTYSEIKYALSLVENHLAEVHIQKTIQAKELNQPLLEGIDIVFSTFPIQLKDVHCFVFPLIPDVKFITTLKSTLTLLYEQINDQRLILNQAI